MVFEVRTARRIHGPALKAIRKARRLDQHQLADQAGIHNSHISRLERGLRRAAPDILAAVATALDVDEHLLTGQVPVIRWLRETAGITERDFAATLDISVNRLRRIESGADQPDSREIEAMCRRLAVSPAALTVADVEAA